MIDAMAMKMRAALAATLGIVALATELHAQDMTPDERAYADPADHRCFNRNPAGRIVVLSQYGGKGPAVTYRIPGSNDINRVTTVTGNGRDPVVLVLLGFDSQIWDVSKVGRGRIRAIYASGQYPQAVSGVERGVPVVFSDVQGRGRTAIGYCPTMKYAGDGQEIVEAAATIRQIFSRGPTDLHEAYSTPTFNIDGGPLRDMPLTPPATTVRSGVAIVTGGMPNGEPGLRWMVARGMLRPADRGDVERWKSMGGHIEPYRSRYSSYPQDMGDHLFGPIYVATRNITHIPEGLVSAAAASFVIPEGLTFTAPENTHGSVVRLVGLKGIPPTSASPPRTDAVGGDGMSSSFDRYALLPLSPGYQPHHVRWNAAGEVIEETPAFNDNDVTHNGSGHQSVRDYLAGRIRPGPFDNMPDPSRIIPTRIRPESVTTPPTMPIPADPVDASRDMTPSVLMSALLLVCGAVGLISLRGRSAATPLPSSETDHPGQVAVAEPEQLEEAAPPRAGTSVRTSTTDRMVAMEEPLRRAINISHQDETTLALLRFRRTARTALQDGVYDDDLDDELEAVVGTHLVKTLEIYFRAARHSGSDHETIERSLRDSVTRLTTRISEIAAMQSLRDADQLREREDYIRARHPASTRLEEGL